MQESVFLPSRNLPTDNQLTMMHEAHTAMIVALIFLILIRGAQTEVFVLGQRQLVLCA